MQSLITQPTELKIPMNISYWTIGGRNSTYYSYLKTVRFPPNSGGTGGTGQTEYIYINTGNNTAYNFEGNLRLQFEGHGGIAIINANLPGNTISMANRRSGISVYRTDYLTGLENLTDDKMVATEEFFYHDNTANTKAQETHVTAFHYDPPTSYVKTKTTQLKLFVTIPKTTDVNGLRLQVSVMTFGDLALSPYPTIKAE